VHSAFRVIDVGVHLCDAVLLAATRAQEFLLLLLHVLQFRLGRVPRVESLLSLLKGLLHATDQADVFVDDNAECEHILHGLARVQLVDARLKVSQRVERAR
jgi:hypothetical protein